MDEISIYWAARLEAEALMVFGGFASSGRSRSNVLESWLFGLGGEFMTVWPHASSYASSPETSSCRLWI